MSPHRTEAGIGPEQGAHDLPGHRGTGVLHVQEAPGDLRGRHSLWMTPEMPGNLLEQIRRAL